MGDMKVGVVNIEDKDFNGLMEEDRPVKEVALSNPSLQVSVSFGRFENDDTLSWEKFSIFSSNKYLEEVGKCATPGSVAKKKAFFEAHYKKVAERKAEIMNQEKVMDKNVSFRSVLSNEGSMEGENGGLVRESGADDGSSNGQFSCDEVKHVTDVTAEVSADELNDEIKVVEECESSVDEAKEGPIVEKSEIALVDEKSEVVVNVQEKPEEALQVDKEVIEVREEGREDNPSKDDTNETNETPKKEVKEVKEERKRNLIKKNEGNARINPTRSSPKVTTKPGPNKTVTSRKTPPSKEVKNIMKPTKKPAAPISKSPQGLSATRVYKPASQITSLSTSQSSIKKVNGSALLRKKQTAPKSLHISMNLDTPASDASTRKSLFMEKMGDKDIVKRAFKTFQKSSNIKTSVEGQNTALKHQNPTKATTIPSLATRPNENGRPAKASSMEKRSGTTAYRPSSKELSKSGARPVEKKTHLQKNPKTGFIDAKTRRDKLNPKAKPMQSSLSMRTLPKSSSDKV